MTDQTWSREDDPLTLACKAMIEQCIASLLWRARRKEENDARLVDTLSPVGSLTSHGCNGRPLCLRAPMMLVRANLPASPVEWFQDDCGPCNQMFGARRKSSIRISGALHDDEA